jgi:tRNA (adenine22-N1)-methyltransferase
LIALYICRRSEGVKLSSKRLNAIVNMVPKSQTVADIGCDHGKIAVELIESGIAENVICTDISENSLDKAKKLAAAKGLCDSVTFRHGDGMHVIRAGEADTAVIAGMGGELIASILQSGETRVPDTLVLSCNTASRLLREWLCDNVFVIVDEQLVLEGRHFYPVILATRGNCESLSDIELEFGPVLLRTKPKTLKAYVNRRIELTKNIRKKLRKASKSNKDALIKEIDAQSKKYEEVRKCL